MRSTSAYATWLTDQQATTEYIWYWHGRRDRAAGMPNLSHIVPEACRADYNLGWAQGATDTPRREVPE